MDVSGSPPIPGWQWLGWQDSDDPSDAGVSKTHEQLPCLCWSVSYCVFNINITVTLIVKLQAAKMTSLDVFGYDPAAPDSDDEPITDVED